MNAYKSIKILYAISSLADEGPTRVLFNIIRNLNRLHFAPSVVTFTPEKEKSLLTEFQALNIPVVQLVNQLTSKPLGTIRRVYALRNLLLRGNFQITHAHCPRSLFFLVAATPRSIISAYTVHGFPDTQFKSIHGSVKGPIITAGANLSLRLIDLPIACSDSVAMEYLEKRGLNLSSVNNGIEPIDLARYNDRDGILLKMGLNPMRRHMLFIGRLSAEKRIAELVKTFSKIDNPPVDLVVLGAGPEESLVRKLANKNVHLAGYHSDIRPFLASCDYYISSSATEGLANTLLEAMSVGMPSLLSSIPSHRFVIERSQGFVAEMFDPSSPNSLLQGVKRLQELDSESIRAGIKQNFRTLFHAQVMTNGYEKLYKEIFS